MSDYPAPEQRRLARRIARGVRETRALGRGSQAAFRSVELSDGPLSFVDDDGNPIIQIGAEDENGNYSVINFDPTVPPTPETPEIISTVDGFIVNFDGTYVDDNPPENLHRVDVHVSPTANFEKDDATLVGSYLSPDGGNVLVPHSSDDPVWVALVAVTTSGVESLPSAETRCVGGIAWEENDQIVLTTGHVAAGSVELPLEHRPIPESLTSWYHFGGSDHAGLPQHDYVLDITAQKCTFPLESGADEGDVVRVQYPYLRGYLPVTPTLVATNGWDLPRDTMRTSLDLPVGTQVGDLLIINAITGWDGWAIAEIDDPRMTRVAHHTTDGLGPGTRRWGVWAGYADALDPLVVRMQAAYSAMGQFAKGSTMALRGIDGPLKWDPDRVAVSPVYASGVGNMPAVPGMGSGAAASVIGSHSGQLTGSWPSPAMDPYAPASIAHGDSGTITHLGWTDSNPVGPTIGPPSVVASWLGVVIGFK